MTRGGERSTLRRVVNVAHVPRLLAPGTGITDIYPHLPHPSSRMVNNDRMAGGEMTLCADVSHLRDIQGKDPCHIQSFNIYQRGERITLRRRVDHPSHLWEKEGSMRLISSINLRVRAQGLLSAPRCCR